MKKCLILLLAFLFPLHALAEVRPVLVSIGLSSASVKVEGRSLWAAGTGKRAPWGIHAADVIYETMLYQYGQTRLGCLFENSFPDSVGPVRSARASQFALREEWDAAFVYNGDAGTAAWSYIEELGLDRSSPFWLNTQKNRAVREMRTREPGVKAPDNLSINLAGLSEQLTEGKRNPLLRNSGCVYSGNSVREIALDWGKQEWSVQLSYDETTGYVMYRNGAPFVSYPSAQHHAPESAVPLTFSCIIIQHSDYQWPSDAIPIMNVIGSGKADFYIDGMLIEGSWVRESIDTPTRYLDQNGSQMLFQDGRIYVAQFPSAHERSTYANGSISYTHVPTK